MIDEAVLTAIREDVQERLKTFSTTYTSSFKSNLVNKVLEGEEEEEERPEDRQLSDESGDDSKPEVLHAGWATKRGGVVKNWKKRYFEVYAESFSYFDKPGGAMKGSINLGGYKLIRDPNALKMTIKKDIFFDLNITDEVESYTKCKCPPFCECVLL